MKIFKIQKTKKSKIIQPIQKIQKSQEKLTIFFLIHFCVFFGLSEFFIFLDSSFRNNFLLFLNFPILRKLHLVNPAEIELLFSRRLFWYIERIFPISYAKSVGVSTFFCKSCKKRSKFIFQSLYTY